MSIDLSELSDDHEARNDYRRANGAPLVSDPNDPGKTLRYRRPSSYANPLDDDSALTEWRIFKAMVGVARSLALAAKVNACKDEDRTEKQKLRDEALDKGSGSEAADMGTALHAMTARIEDASDVDFDPPEQYVADLRAYTDFLEEYGLVSELVEVHMVNDAYRAAGTADRVYKLTKALLLPDGRILLPGTLVLVDLKTGQKLDFSLPGFCVQTAIYADGVLYDVINERRLPTPPINREWTMLVHLPVGSGRCTPMWMSVELGLRGALLAYDIKEWQNAWKAGRDGHDAFPVAVAEVDDDEMDVDTERDLMLNYIKTRIAVVRCNDNATASLLRQWPKSVPTPKQGLSDPDHIRQVLDVLDVVERDHSLPFQPDPRANGKHHSELPISNSVS